MKILGHPIHLMLIHFPSALFPMDLVCSVIAYCTAIVSFSQASYYAMAGGAALGWVAVIAGTFDLAVVIKNKPSSVKKALIHGGINTAVLIVYSLFALAAFKKGPEYFKDNAAILIIKALLNGLMAAGNFIGGSLVLKDKVLDEKPQ